MAYIKEYWVDKEQRASVAKKHTEEMNKKYKEQIEESIKNTRIYVNAFNEYCFQQNYDMEIVVEDMDSVSAVLKYGGKNTAVLNFSSYKNPGGMFLKGSKAQEECLCHESFLYNVISKFDWKFYEWNRHHMNKALYLNRGLYSPDVVFTRGDIEQTAGVITCAAPNLSASRKYCGISSEENTQALRSRIRFVLDIARYNNVKTLILGAYGCGVFGQDAKEVAGIFRECLDNGYKCFDKVVFAVPNGRDTNLQKFINVFA